MPTPTVIRHKSTTTGFIQVITYFDGASLETCLQEYRVNPDTGRTCLDKSMPWGSEAKAIQAFDKIAD